MSTLLNKWRKQYRIIFEVLHESPRVYYKDLAEFLGINREYAQKRFMEALDLEYIVGPEIRIRSFKNLGEYLYLLKCQDPDLSYLKYRENPHVVFHTQMGGFSDLFIISKRKIDIDEDVIIEGYRTDYNVSYAPDHLWEKALENMWRKVEIFDPSVTFQKNIIQDHFAETIEWDSQDEMLYNYFKYDLRNSLDTVMKEYNITGWKIYEFLERLPEICTVFTSYFPETLPFYDPYLFMFETDYEDFIIELFSELPTTSSYFKVSDKLFVYAHVSKPFIRSTNRITDPSKTHILSLLVELLNERIVRSKAHAILERFKRKEI